MPESYLKWIIKVSSLIGLFALCGVLTSCAYRLGSPDRSLPGGYRQVYIPIFKNKSMEPGIEVAFTNALIQEYERSKIARVTDSNQAEVLVEGVIKTIKITKAGDISSESDTYKSSLPMGTVLTTQYQVVVTAEVVIRRNSDKSVLWSNEFVRERVYGAAQVQAVGINTVNPLYNHAARRQNIEEMAAEMMSEAHDRTTENF